MTAESILQSFKQTVCTEVRLVPEGINRYRVFSPFTFSDGDHLALVLKQDNSGLILSDEGHTLMHLSYWKGSGDRVPFHLVKRGSEHRVPHMMILDHNWVIT